MSVPAGGGTTAGGEGRHAMRRVAGVALVAAGLLLAAGFPTLALFHPVYVPVPFGNIIPATGWVLFVAGAMLLVPKRYRP